MQRTGPPAAAPLPVLLHGLQVGRHRRKTPVDPAVSLLPVLRAILCGLTANTDPKFFNPRLRYSARRQSKSIPCRVAVLVSLSLLNCIAPQPWLLPLLHF